MTILLQILLVLSFGLAAVCKYLREASRYQQKDVSWKLPAWLKLETRFKDTDSWLMITWLNIGLLTADISVRDGSIWSGTAAFITGGILYWILFDGLFARLVKGQSFWYVGITSRIDKTLKTKAWSRLVKLSALVIATVLLVLVNLIT